MPYFDRRLYFLIELAADASFYRLSAFRFRQKNAKFAETRTKTCYEKNVIAPLRPCRGVERCGKGYPSRCHRQQHGAATEYRRETLGVGRPACGGEGRGLVGRKGVCKERRRGPLGGDAENPRRQLRTAADHRCERRQAGIGQRADWRSVVLQRPEQYGYAPRRLLERPDRGRQRGYRLRRCAT